MKKLVEPSKIILINKKKIIKNYKSFSLDEFIAFAKNIWPDNAIDPKFEFILDYDDCGYDGCDCEAYLKFSWKQEIKNPKYEKQMNKYLSKCIIELYEK